MRARLLLLDESIVVWGMDLPDTVRAPEVIVWSGRAFVYDDARTKASVKIDDRPPLVFVERFALLMPRFWADKPR